MTLDGPVLGVDAVLENRVVFGSVSAQRQDWLAGLEALDRARERWQDALEQVVGLRVPLDRFADAFAHSCRQGHARALGLAQTLEPRSNAVRTRFEG